jgi:nucleoside-diphosphate-sugar epimerase
MGPRKALITGGTGFIGSALCSRLVADGWDVHLVVRSESDLSLLDGILKRVTLHVHDGSTEGMQLIVRKATPATVFHLASLFLAEHKPADIEPLIRSNITFGTQLLEAMTANGITELVNTGTSWQHFESREYDPVCLYAATKQAFESILTFYVNATPLRAITLKLFDTYGPNDPRNKLFSLLRRAANTQVPLAMSPGEQLVDLVYLDDAVEAYLAAVRRLNELEVNQEAYAVSSESPIMLKEVVHIYGSIRGVSVPVEWGHRPYRLREVMIPWNKGQTLPGWQPKTSIEEGIRRMEGILE